MKKIVIIFCACLMYLSTIAQTAYNKMLPMDTTTWQHFGMMYGVKTSSVQSITIFPNSVAAIDTITISGKLYKKVYELSIPAYLNYSNKTLVGYTREDTIAKKIFFKSSLVATEFVLYDFSLNVNDSTIINFPNNSFYSGYYRVDSIVTKNEVCGPRKHFYLRKHVNNSNPNLEYYEFIESIGSNFHFLYPYNNGLMQSSFSFNSGCAHKWSNGLACKKNKSIQQYQSCTASSPVWNSYVNSCVYLYFIGGLTEFSVLKEFSVYPNPANNKVVLSFSNEKSQIFSINIVDVLGKLIQSNKNVSFSAGQNTYELNTAQLESGVYSIVIENKEHKSTHPVIIQN